MEQEPLSGPRKRRGRRRLCVGLVAVTMVVSVAVAVVLGLTLRQQTDDFKTTFLQRCQKFKDYNCQKLWDAFQRAYVNRDPCNVSAEAYDPLIAAASFKPSCSKMMFWSKTKDVVHAFTEKRDCFVTLEDTVLGSVLNDLTWCGKKGSNETFTTGCPGWTECENNPSRSFWNRVSADFAEAACGDVTAMLNGSITVPFNPTSIFASIEVKHLSSAKVKKMNVVLVTQENYVTNCTNGSLKDLQKELDAGIQYDCKEVSESQLQKCSSSPEKPCEDCW